MRRRVNYIQTRMRSGAAYYRCACARHRISTTSSSGKKRARGKYLSQISIATLLQYIVGYRATAAARRRHSSAETAYIYIRRPTLPRRPVATHQFLHPAAAAYFSFCRKPFHRPVLFSRAVVSPPYTHQQKVKSRKEKEKKKRLSNGRASHQLYRQPGLGPVILYPPPLTYIYYILCVYRLVVVPLIHC